MLRTETHLKTYSGFVRQFCVFHCKELKRIWKQRIPVSMLRTETHLKTYFCFVRQFCLFQCKEPKRTWKQRIPVLMLPTEMYSKTYSGFVANPACFIALNWNAFENRNWNALRLHVPINSCFNASNWNAFRFHVPILPVSNVCMFGIYWINNSFSAVAFWMKPLDSFNFKNFG